MKKMIILFLLFVVLFALSAGGSWYLRSLQQPTDSFDGTGAASSPPGRLDIPSPISEQTKEDLDRGYQTRQQASSLRDWEKRLDERERKLETIRASIESERKKDEDSRKDLDKILREIEDKITRVEQVKREQLRRESALDRREDEIKKKLLIVDDTQRKGLKDSSILFDKMEPGEVARMILKMIDDEEMDTAVKIFGFMAERKQAQVLTEINKSSREGVNLGNRLMARYRGLKKTAAASPPTAQ